MDIGHWTIGGGGTIYQYNVLAHLSVTREQLIYVKDIVTINPYTKVSPLVQYKLTFLTITYAKFSRFSSLKSLNHEKTKTET